jgi:hypothetical protein
MALFQLVLTVFGMVHVVLPHRLGAIFRPHRPLRHCARLVLSHLRQRLLLRLHRRPHGFLDYPYEIRAKIYDFVCSRADGSYAGVVHILLLNKQISAEVKKVHTAICLI